MTCCECLFWAFVAILGIVEGIFYYFYNQIKRHSEKITNIKELTKKIKYWKERLGISHLIIKYKLDRKMKVDGKCAVVKKNRIYELTINPKKCREATILHELLHIKGRHNHICKTDRPLIRWPINIITDMIVDPKVVLIWKKKR